MEETLVVKDSFSFEPSGIQENTATFTVTNGVVQNLQTGALLSETSFKGKPFLKSLCSTVNFTRPTFCPVGSTVTLSGWLQPPAMGNIRFFITCTDMVSFYIGDTLVLENTIPQPKSTISQFYTFSTTDYQPIRLTWKTKSIDSRLLLEWSSMTFSRTIVSSNAFAMSADGNGSFSDLLVCGDLKVKKIESESLESKQVSTDVLRVGNKLLVGNPTTNYTLDYIGGNDNAIELAPNTGNATLTIQGETSSLKLGSTSIMDNSTSTLFSVNKAFSLNIASENMLTMSPTSVSSSVPFQLQGLTSSSLQTGSLESTVSSLGVSSAESIAVSGNSQLGGLSVLKQNNNLFLGLDSTFTTGGWESTTSDTFLISKQDGNLAFSLSTNPTVTWNTILHMDNLGNVIFGGHGSVFGSTLSSQMIIGGQGISILQGGDIQFGSLILNKDGFKDILTWTPNLVSLSKSTTIAGTLTVSSDVTIGGNLILGTNLSTPFLTAGGLEVSGSSSFQAMTSSSIACETLFLDSFLIWGNTGFAPPSKSVRSEGTKLVLFPSLSPSTCDFAIGVDKGSMWSSVQNRVGKFTWYAGDLVLCDMSDVAFHYRNQVILGVDDYNNGTLQLLGSQSTLTLSNWKLQVCQDETLTIGDNTTLTPSGELTLSGLVTINLVADTTTMNSLTTSTLSVAGNGLSCVDGSFLIQGQGSSLSLGASIVLSTSCLNIMSMMTLDESGLSVLQGQLHAPLIKSDHMTTTTLTSGIATLGDTTVADLFSTSVSISGHTLTGDLNGLITTSNLKVARLEAGDTRVINLTASTAHLDSIIVGHTGIITLRNITDYPVWYYLGAIIDFIHVTIYEISATTQAHFSLDKTYHTFSGVPVCQAVLVGTEVFLELPAERSCCITTQGTLYVPTLTSEVPSPPFYSTLSSPDLLGVFTDLSSSTLQVSGGLTSEMIATGNVVCSSITSQDDLSFDVAGSTALTIGKTLTFEGNLVSTTADFGTLAQPVGNMFSSSLSTGQLESKRFMTNSCLVSQLETDSLTVAGSLFDMSSGHLSLSHGLTSTFVNSNKLNIGRGTLGLLFSVTGQVNLQDETPASFSVFEAPIVSGIVHPDCSTVDILGAPSSDSLSLRVSSGKVLFNSDLIVQGNTILGHLVTDNLVTSSISSENNLNFNATLVTVPGGLTVSGTTNLGSVVATSLSTPLIAVDTFQVTSSSISLGLTNITPHELTFGNHFQVDSLGNTKVTSLTTGAIVVSSPSRLDFVGTSVTNGGLLIATRTAPYVIDTDVTDSNRGLTLLSNTGAVSLCMRNTSDSSYWDMIVEDSGDKRLLFQETRSSGVSKSWFSIDSETGLTRIEGAALIKSAIIRDSLQVGTLAQITFQEGDVTSIFCNSSNSANSKIGLSLQNDTLNGGVMFLNSSNKTTDGGASCMTLRNNIGNLRLQSQGAGLTFITGGGAVFDATVPVAVTCTVDAISNSMGALSVAGGLAVSKSVNVGGDIIGSGNLGSPTNKFGAVYLTSQPIVESSLVYKSHIQEIACAMDTINEVKAYTFKSRDNSERSFGFIAEEMAEVVKGTCVVPDVGIRYAELVPLLWKGLQEQQVQINELQNIILSLSKHEHM